MSKKIFIYHGIFLYYHYLAGGLYFIYLMENKKILYASAETDKEKVKKDFLSRLKDDLTFKYFFTKIENIVKNF